MKSAFSYLKSIIFKNARPSISRVISNTSWLIFDKGINLVAGLLIGTWVARYMGITQFGQFNYVLAYVSLFSPIAMLGLNDLVIRNIVRNPAHENEILGTTFFLQIISGLLALGVSIIVARVIFPGDPLLKRLVIIMALGFIIQPLSNNVSYWFESQLQSKYSVLARNWALIIVSLVKIGLILWGASLVAFAWANTIQIIIFTVIIFFLYIKTEKSIKAWKFSAEQARILLKDSWPLIISGLAIMIYMRIDQIMLSNMIGPDENGIYSAAVRLSELWYFLPVALGASLFPAIVRTREMMSEKIYNERMQLFFDVMTLSSYIIVIPLSIFAPLLIQILYGSAYTGSGGILRIHIWAFLFVSLGVSRSRWLIAENLTGISMICTILGAVINIVINYLLIPKYTGAGAAWATFVSYAVSAYLTSFFFVRTRPVFKQQSLSLFSPLRGISIIRMIQKVVLINE